MIGRKYFNKIQRVDGQSLEQTAIECSGQFKNSFDGLLNRPG